MIFELSLKRKDFPAILRSPEILQGFHLVEVLQPVHHDAIAAWLLHKTCNVLLTRESFRERAEGER
jgi:hypothetical protein